MLRMRNRCLELVLALSIIILTGGCATGGMQESPAEEVAVQVNNNTIPPTSLTISVITEGGQQQLLGVMDPSSTSTFTYNPTALRSAQFHLVGETTAGGEIVSRPFSLIDATAVEWDVDLNTIDVIG